jgi:hypothetical protein
LAIPPGRNAGEDGVGINDPNCIQPEQATARKTLRIGAENNNGLLSFAFNSFFLSFRFCPERVLANLELCPSETRPNRTKLPFSVCLVSRRLASRRHVASCRVASLLPSFLQGSAPCYGVQDACVKHYNELVTQTIGSEPNVVVADVYSAVLKVCGT